ncbi:pre-rRNA-processing protein esf1 [Entophlyctis luteolus]|nr:pre-rRNA-processing protein esf1 [Entophlyctis luteolus]
MDSRFSSLARNPRFLRPKRRDTKVTVDPRFAAVFGDKDKSKKAKGSAKGSSKDPATDKYGRRLKASSDADNLKRFYRMDDEEDADEADGADADGAGDADDDEKDERSRSGDVEESDDDDYEDEDDGDDDREVAKAVQEQESYGLIRGEGLLESSDEDEDEDDDDDGADVDVSGSVDDGEVEDEIEVLGPVSRRFAAVNMDWDNIKARDLFKVLDAFRPKKGVLESVEIFKSEFGKEQLEREAREGPPKELFGASSAAASSNPENQPLFSEATAAGANASDGQQASARAAAEALRKYELSRLRYYYAVVTCDTAATATAIHAAVDGTEFEKSANVFDLKYIPDDMTFDVADRVDVATAASIAASYVPPAPTFATAALQHSKPVLTWDLDDPARVRVTRKKFSKEELKDMDFKAYLASSGSEDEDSADEEELRERARKYKEAFGLVGGDDSNDGANDGEVMGDMEITFVPGLSENAAAKMKKMENTKEETVFDQERRKRKEKAQAKKKEQQKSLSDDDDFFNPDKPADDSEPAPAKAATKQSKAEADARSRAELELMMYDEAADAGASGSAHFDMKEIIKNEKLKGKKKLRAKANKKKLSAEGLVQDDFDIDVNDSRFAEVKSSHHFAIDPTNPHFKKTAAMAKLLDARKKAAKATPQAVPAASKDSQQSSKNELMEMVNAIKRKTSAPSSQPQGKRGKLSK